MIASIDEVSRRPQIYLGIEAVGAAPAIYFEAQLRETRVDRERCRYVCKKWYLQEPHVHPCGTLQILNIDLIPRATQ
jgi:hypothetical protein